MSAYSKAYSQAIEILLFIHFKTQEKKYEYLSTNVMSKGLNIPVPTLNKVITKLKDASLLVSKAGPAGGLAITKDADEITLLDIFLAVEKYNNLFNVHTEFNRDILYETNILDKITNNGILILNEAEEQMKQTLKRYRLSDLF